MVNSYSVHRLVFLLIVTALGVMSAPTLAQTGRRGTTPRRNATTPAEAGTPERRQRQIEDSTRRANIRQALQDRADSIRAARSADRRPSINWPDRYATRFSERTSRSPFILRDPKAVGTDIRLNQNKDFSVYERVRPEAGVQIPTATPPTSGQTPQAPAPTSPNALTTNSSPTALGLPFRPGEAIPFDAYNRLQSQRAQQSLWRDYSARTDNKSATKGRGLLPKLELPPVVDRLFGGNNIDFKPNGFVLLDFGYLHQFIDNPQIPVQQRRQGNFIFNEQININFNGKIGERLGMLANFDTKASFNFENALKLNYKPQGLGQGLGLPGAPRLPNAPDLSRSLGAPSVPDFTPKNESIIQGFEMGNINWQINSQLIPGVQNLFGAKAQLRFGRLNATIVGSQQRSRKASFTVRSGQTGRPFELRADNYDENRHFFLSQFFRSNYERGLKLLPMITTGVTITRLEVYVTNRTNTTETLRNVAGFSDLGENGRLNSPNNPNVQIIAGSQAADNRANTLYDRLRNNADVRAVDRANFALDGLGLQKGADYDLLRGAKRLTDREFKFHPELGYISLLTPLRNDEVLAVAYEYSYQGRAYKVGELTEDYQNLKDDQVLILKMLKSATIRNNLNLPMWDLMMKNIYTISQQQINRQGFQLRIVYKDDQTGIDNPNLQEGLNLKDKPLVQVFNMDQLNQQLDKQPDGNFDFVENVTVDPRFGRIMFPVLEPFGSFLSRQFETFEEDLRAKYVFNELYRLTLADAQQLPDRNKFFLKGAVQSGSGQTIQLPFGVKEESVQITAGGVPLTPGGDYIFESSTGQLRIINEGVAASGREIRVEYEQPDLFQNQIRRLIGTRLDYAISPDMSVGITAMNMRETPAGFLTRVAIGNEPVNNTILGFNLNMRKDVPGLTRFMDRLPLLQTKEPSTLALQVEGAQLFPGVAPRVNDNSFIDDFEAARTIYDLTRQPNRWRLGATPLQFPQGTLVDPLQYAYNRAKISVYSVDQTLYNDNLPGAIPINLADEEKQNFYERFFLPNDLFPGRSLPTVVLPSNVLDVAYFPAERGMYNYNPDLNPDGTLKNPRQNFGSVTRAVGSDIDFDNANVETLTFWMMDPFIGGANGVVRGSSDPSRNRNNTTGGRVIFNLGDISEDVIPDGRFNFENGLKVAGDDRSRENEETPWGYATRQQFVTNAFQNTEGALEQQDVGLDGMSNTQERTKLAPFLNQVRQRLNPDAFAEIQKDPSNDDFKFYLGPGADSAKYIVARYKQFMGMDGNSKELNNRDNYLTPSSTNLPDIEDLNIDNTINDNNAYYEYPLDLRPGQLQVGKNYIVDKVETNGTTWYQFRIPVRDYARKVGNINGFKSIRFIRMYVTDFQEPVVLRFGQLQLEANQYRRYTGDLNQRGLQEVPEPYDAQFKVTTVNIEENSQAGSSTVTAGGVAQQKYLYTVPPGFVRDRDFTQIASVQLNEQSMAMSVTNLRDGDSRGAFRIMNMDLLFRKRLRMFVHMHNPDDESGKVSAFMRVGTDFTDNYYEIETQGLVATPSNVTGDGEDEAVRRRVWPLENEFDISLNALVDLKNGRNQQFTRRSALPFVGQITSADGDKTYKVTIVGNPDLSAVQSLMIGMRNPKSEDQLPKTFTIWVNELRTNGYDQTAGQAAVAALNLKLADFANITASGKIQTFGFGGVQTKVGERSRDFTTEYGISSAITVDKLFPESWGLRIPMYLNLDSRRVAPQFDPLDPDNPLEEALLAFPDGSARSAYRRMVEDRTTRRGINFSNVRKVKTGTNQRSNFYDIENFGLSYAFNDIERTNILTDQFLQRQYRGGLTYTFSPQPRIWEPFKNVKSLERKYLFWLKDFNLSVIPSVVSIRSDMDRSFIKTQLRNADPSGNGLTTVGVQPLFEKYFLFNRYYDLTWNLTKNLLLTYKTQANAIIDEPAGDLDSQWKKDSVWRSVQKLGRMKNFQQDIRFTYRLPLDKLPLTDWISADVNYAMGYQFQANAYGLTDSTGTSFGNVLRNNRERGINGRVDLVLLYNKIKALRWANTPSPVRKNFARSPGDVEELQRNDNRLIKAVTRTLLTVRGINFNYTVQENTLLPGFLRTPRFFGLDREGAPGLGFVLGSQERNIQIKAAERGWTTRSTVLNTAFQQSISKNFTASTNLEPFKDFRMNIQMRLTRTDSYQEFYRPRTIGGDFESQSPVRNGQFSMSFWSFRTAFKDVGFDPKVDLSASKLFERFEDNRQIILDRLNAQDRRDLPSPTIPGAYSANSQDVLIPAFFAAYSGQDPKKTKLSPFYNFPLPNWRVDYTGLSNLGWFKKRFSSFTLAHSYSSNYSVGNFVSSLDYSSLYVNLAVMGYPPAHRTTLDGSYIPVFVMSTIQMQERFAPLIGIQFQTKSRWSARLEYNQSRDVALNLSNAQVADLTNKDITTTVGFTKNNMRLPTFLTGGQRKKLKNDMTFQFQFTLRDTRAIQRKIDAEQTITQGNYNFQIRPTINYTVSRRLNLNFYFDRTYNDPLVLNSFRRATTAGGVQVRFNLAE